MTYFGLSTQRWQILTCVNYAMVGLAMVALQKLLVSRFFFDYPMVVLMLQMALSLFVFELARMFGCVKVLPYTLERGKDMLLPSVLYAFHAYFSMSAMEGMNLPMYGSVKRCIPLVSLVLGIVILRKPRPCRALLMALTVIVVGAALASAYDFYFDGWSYLYGVLAVVSQALYLSLIERHVINQQFGTVEMAYLNSFNCLVCFLIGDLIQDQIRDAFMYFLTSATPLFWLCLVGMLLLGMQLQFAQMACICANSALTTAVVTNAAAATQTALAYFVGWFIYFDIEPTMTNNIGIVLTAAGTAWYASIKYKQAISGDFMTGNKVTY